jgi:hypothetical protein
MAVLLGSPSEARANGRFPESNQLIFSKSDPNLVLLRVTFGVLISHDRGRTFDWVCEASVGYSGVEDPMYAIGPSGRIIATTFQGITGTDDRACSWKFQDPSMNEIFVDLTQNPNDAKNVVAFSSGYRTADDAGNSLFDSQLWETKDEGKTFAKLGPPLQERLLGYTVDITKTDPKRIYVTAVRDRGKTGAALLLTSKDHGDTWTEQQIPLVGTESSIWIAGVDPDDAEKVYLRTFNNPDAPGRLILRDKDPANPDLGTLKTLFTSKAPLDGFALSPDNKKVWVGSPLDGVWMASTADYKFQQKSETAVKCLAAADDGLWSCSNEAAKPIGFIAGISTDDGATWTSKAHFCSIRGALACSAGSTTAEQCNWPIQRELLGCDPDSTGDGGTESDGETLPDGGRNNGAPTTTTTSSCDCQSVLPTDGWSSAGGAAASALAAVIAVLRRRRRRGPRE